MRAGSVAVPVCVPACTCEPPPCCSALACLPACAGTTSRKAAQPTGRCAQRPRLYRDCRASSSTGAPPGFAAAAAAAPGVGGGAAAAAAAPASTSARAVRGHAGAAVSPAAPRQPRSIANGNAHARCSGRLWAADAGGPGPCRQPTPAPARPPRGIHRPTSPSPAAPPPSPDDGDDEQRRHGRLPRQAAAQRQRGGRDAQR